MQIKEEEIHHSLISPLNVVSSQHGMFHVLESESGFTGSASMVCGVKSDLHKSSAGADHLGEKNDPIDGWLCDF